MLGLVLVIAIIILLVNNNDLKRRISELQKKGQNDIKFCPNCGYQLVKGIESSVNYEKNEAITISPSVDSINNSPPVKQRDEKEVKNSTILSVGAILVVIAAIIFLTSTWDTTLNSIKVLTLFFMLLVFLGASNIADKFLKLPQTSKVFLYIALSYLPIIFFSIPVFRLFGDYFSITGDGKYIYLFISSSVLASIYYYVMNRRKDIFSGVGSIIFQVLSVITFTMMFTTDINYILMSIGLYNICNYYLIKHGIVDYDQLIIKNIYRVLVAVILGSFLFFHMISFSIMYNYAYILLLITIYLNIYLYLNKESYNEKLFNIASPILILYTFVSLARIIDNNIVAYYFFGIIGIIFLYLKDYFVCHKLKIESFVISSILLGCLYISSFIYHSNISSYLVVLVLGLFTIINYVLFDDEKYKDNIGMFIPIPFGVFVFNFILENNISTVLLHIIFLLAILINNYFEHRKSLKTSIDICCIISSFVGFIYTLQNYSDSYLLLGIVGICSFVVYFIISLLNKNRPYKYISYSWLLLGLTYILHALGLKDGNLYSISLTIGLVLTVGLEIIFKQKETSDYKFLLVYFILGISSTLINDNIISLMMLVIMSLLYVYVNTNYQKKHYVYYLPVVVYSLMLFNGNFMPLNNINYIILPMLLCLLLYMCYRTKDKHYIFMSLISLLLSSSSLEFNKYVYVSLAILCFSVYYLSYDNKKDLYKSVIYILIAVFIRMILEDTGLDEITLLNKGVFVILAIVLSRTIIINHSKDYKIFEYLSLIYLYFTAIASYQDEFNGMLFILLLLVLTILGYIHKWGPIFLCSLLFILINVFLLTKIFWLSIPWWMYILLIGISLISFAIKNEMTENKKKENKLLEMAKRMNL